MNIKDRQRIEKGIVRRILKSAKSKGCFVQVADINEDRILSAGDKRLFGDCMACDDNRILFYNSGKEFIGWVQIILGNDGYDAIADYHDSATMNDLLADAMKYADNESEKAYDHHVHTRSQVWTDKD